MLRKQVNTNTERQNVTIQVSTDFKIKLPKHRLTLKTLTQWFMYNDGNTDQHVCIYVNDINGKV